jgi:outer membrane protein
VRPFVSWLTSIACFAALAGGVLVPGSARADDSSADSDKSKDEPKSLAPSGFEAGMRLGYAMPMGQVTGAGTNPALSNLYSGMMPIWFDVGVRASPHFYIGGYFQYGVAFVGPLSGSPTALDPCAGGTSCSGSVLAGGLDARYHAQPDQSFDPWVGLGIGYEVANLSMSQGGSSAGMSLSGFQLVNLSVGGDVRTSRNFAFGPYAMLSVGEYSGCGFSDAAASLGSCTVPQTALHEWFSFGVRAAFDSSP